ncbi:MAG: ELM1/GtrOC1 family putative glycosyltransferase [Gammaproteobacteria bacterium]
MSQQNAHPDTHPDMHKDVPFRIWVLSDGRPGHFNQAKGIVRAIALHRLVMSEWVPLKLRVGLFRNIMRQLLNRTRGPLSLEILAWFYAIKLPDDKPDMIVSSGGRTSFATAWLGRVYKVPTVFSGSLRGLSAKHFSAVISILPQPDIVNAIVLPVMPSMVDPQLLQEIQMPANLANRTCWTMLVGGDGAGYQYQEMDWLLLANMMNKMADRFQISWLICSSPRTGQQAEQCLKIHLNADVVLRAHWYSEDQSSVLLTCLAAAKRIFVTEDSMTMLTEAICSGKPVCSLSPQSCHPDLRYQGSMQQYAKQTGMQRYAIEALATDPERLDFSPLPSAGCTYREQLADQLLPLLKETGQ